MKTIAVTFNGVERFEVPDDKVEDFKENLSLAYNKLMKQFNLQYGDIDIEEIWCEEEEKEKADNYTPPEPAVTPEQEKALNEMVYNIINHTEEYSLEDIHDKVKEIMTK